jgi:hypothetical protein
MIWRMEDMDTMLGVHDALGLTKPGLDIKGKVCEGARGPGYVVGFSVFCWTQLMSLLALDQASFR